MQKELDQSAKKVLDAPRNPFIKPILGGAKSSAQDLAD
jgi:hypothetical protein